MSLAQGQLKKTKGGAPESKLKISKPKINKHQIEQFQLGRLFSIDSIKIKLIIITVAFTTIPLLFINILSSSISTSTLRNTSKQLTADIVNQTSSTVNYFLEDIEKNITKYIINDLNSTTENLLINYSKAKQNQTEKVKVVQSIQKGLVYLSSIENSIESAAIVHRDGTVMGKLPSITPDELSSFKDLELNGEYIWQKGLGSDVKSIYFIRKVPNTAIGEEFGLMFCPIKLDAIKEDMEKIKLLDGADVYLVDQEGKMIYNKNTEKLQIKDYIWEFIKDSKDTIGSTIKNNTLITYATTDNSWRVIAELPQKSLTKNLHAATVIIWLIIGGIAAIAVGVSFVVAKSFSGPIIHIMKLMKLAEDGDLTVRIDTKRTDEIGLLCLSFNKMMGNIQKLVQDTQIVIEQTIAGSKTLAVSTNQSVEAFEQLALSIGDIAVGSSDQAVDAQKTSKKMDQLSDSIQRVMVKTKDIYTDNQGAKIIIEEATQSMEMLNTTMASSIQVANKIKESITELSGLTRSIGEIMKLVDGISEQTNLLALNASIEAARAGAVGKGFAVVAHEVRNLAEQSKHSTDNVRHTLHTIEKKTKDAVNLVKAANAIFANQEAAVDKADVAFRTIIQKLKNMDSDIGNINTEVNDMEYLKENMLENISRIKMITEDTASATEQVNALSEEQKAVMTQLLEVSKTLSTSMDILSKAMAHFKIN
ncbi:hypothetical protein CS063_08515 [Sporanaerobium hydrogeniformans]|uniref:Uncharacterized protein n=1 Tax=Sporanaerobium hydrogeniformans TaxID=3072179 RepID=A0AC61DC65_9FIRM|nr:methyl-accepting chemotaxis protein [Sporanaerobium hydrogeniformans]PHV70801.1 hypothetical protein CS063_08515 [Sporanaerobium hydrogeniformans]